MAAVARLLPPRPTPKPTVEDIVHEVTDTSISDVSEIRAVAKEPKTSRPPPPLPVVAKDRKALHPGLILARTIAFFTANIALDFFRMLRAFVKSHWVRAAARARV